MTEYLIRVMTGQIRTGVCREKACRQRIEFRLNIRGKWVPFDAGARPLHSERDPLTHVAHDLMSPDDLHFATCKHRKRADGASA